MSTLAAIAGTLTQKSTQRTGTFLHSFLSRGNDSGSKFTCNPSLWRKLQLGYFPIQQTQLKETRFSFDPQTSQELTPTGPQGLSAVIL
ncbi:MAG: hypothetical protein F6K32_08635 [Desertifilum sp. SIO1I2]|nr:hypothetical protein [Desertifilum sp. SIO1I2]